MERLLVTWPSIKLNVDVSAANKYGVAVGNTPVSLIHALSKF